MATISKRFTFEAAHRLLRHGGKCKTLHGHSYKVDIEISGPIQENHPLVVGVDDDPRSGDNVETGMVLDFSALNTWWKEIEGDLDHVTILEHTDPLVRILSEAGQVVIMFDNTPTAENIATWLRDDFSNWLIKQPGWEDGFRTPVVRVWETEKSWAEA